MAKGLSNNQVATAAKITPSTVKVHVSSIVKQLGVTNRVAALLVWRRLRSENGLVAELRKSRSQNQRSIVKLQELIRIETEAIELLLKRING